MFRHILHILSPSIVSWRLWSSIKLHMQTFKLSASTTLILTNGEIDCRFRCGFSGSDAGTNELSLNFSVMAFNCFKHLTQVWGCLASTLMTKFSLLQSPSTWSQQLTIPWFDLIRKLRKTGWGREKIRFYTRCSGRQTVTYFVVPHAGVSADDSVLVVVFVDHQLFGRLTHHDPIAPRRTPEISPPISTFTVNKCGWFSPRRHIMMR